jgi:hypothetical protein
VTPALDVTAACPSAVALVEADPAAVDDVDVALRAYQSTRLTEWDDDAFAIEHVSMSSTRLAWICR